MRLLKNKKTALLQNLGGGGTLPSEYQEVDYIYRQSGTVYINTGYNFTTNSDMRLVFLMPSTSGNILSGSATAYNFEISQNSNFTKFVSKRITYNLDLPYNNKYDLRVGKNGIYANDNLLSSDDVSENASSIQLCAFSSGWSSSVHIYKFQAHDNGMLVKDLIPCYRKLDNVVGMYDIVNKEFIAKDGNGVMAYGNEIN